MSNIMINEVCNLSCPYCFTNKYTNKEDSKEITLENFRDIVRFILTKEGNRIGLIGGEPTLHSQFEDLIHIAKEEISNCKCNKNRELLLFTNGILLDKWADVLADNEVSVLVNVNSPKDIGEKSFEKVKRNIGIVRSKGVGISVGVNFYKPDLNTAFIEGILEEYKIKSLRIGLPAPNTSELRHKGCFENLLYIKDSLFNFFKKLSNMGVSPHFDCQKFPKCLLTMDEIEFLKSFENYEGLLGDSVCTPVLDFLQNKHVVRCFGMSGEGLSVPISKFENYEDAHSYFETTFDNVGKLLPSSKQCMSCYLREVGRCQAGCLSYKLPAIAKVLGDLKDEFGTEV